MDSLNINSLFFEIDQRTMDSELSKSMAGNDLTFASFQEQPGARALIQGMMKLIEMSVEFFYKKKGFHIDKNWGVKENDLILIEQRMEEVYPNSYKEYVSIFSYMSMTVNTAERIIARLAENSAPKIPVLEKLPFVKSQKTEWHVRLKEQAEFFDIYSLVIRGLYLRNKKLKPSAWSDIDEKLAYIRDADTYLRSKLSKYINPETHRVTPEGLTWLKSRFQEKFEEGYDSLVDDFPSIAETWVRGVVTAKHSLKYTDRKRFEKLIDISTKRYQQVSQTIVDMHDLERNYGAVKV